MGILSCFWGLSKGRWQYWARPWGHITLDKHLQWQKLLCTTIYLKLPVSQSSLPQRKWYFKSIAPLVSSRDLAMIDRWTGRGQNIFLHAIPPLSHLFPHNRSLCIFCSLRSGATETVGYFDAKTDENWLIHRIYCITADYTGLNFGNGTIVNAIREMY